MTTSDPRPRQPEVVLLPEPRVLCKEVAETDCKRALLTGPYGARNPSHSNRLSLGLIGTYNLIDQAKDWLSAVNDPIASTSDRPDSEITAQRRHKLLFPDFPGCPAAFDKSVVLEPHFEQKITLDELTLLDKRNKVAYIEGLLQIIEAKIQRIIEATERKPDSIVLLLTEEIYELCHIVGNYHRRLGKRRASEIDQLDLFKDFDTLQVTPRADIQGAAYRNLRSALKKIAMDPKYGVPIQIIRENTLAGKDTQNLATRSWNLCTGLYYKAGDFPWILDGMDPRSCFLGISFYHKKTQYSDDVFSSMAHLFSNDFNSVVLRGDKVPFDEVLKSPVLDREAARKIVEKALGEFSAARGRYPERLVVHKTSRYTQSEIQGFEEALRNLGIAYDLVSLTKAPLRLIRWGQYPVPRGAAYASSDHDAYLYTKGFVPDLQTYPGTHIPSPFWVQKARGDSSMKTICSEILMLTKLNWNTADFCCGVPITLSFARNVGDVFKEFDDSDRYEPSRFFRFYM
jgi:hypothetical protein